MLTKFFLKIGLSSPTIKGGSKNVNHPDWLEVVGMGPGWRRPFPSGGTETPLEYMVDSSVEEGTSLWVANGQGFHEAILHVEENPGYWLHYLDVGVSDVTMAPTEDNPHRWVFTMTCKSVTYHQGSPVLAPGAAAALVSALGEAGAAVAHHMRHRYAPGPAGKK